MSEHETIADILAEMRIFKCRNLETGELESCNAIANYFADRLDAAHKREKHKETITTELPWLVADIQLQDGRVIRFVKGKGGNNAD